MRDSAGFGFVLVLSLLFGGAARAEPPARRTVDPVQQALAWLAAVREKDTDAAMALSRLPFLDINIPALRRDRCAPVMGARTVEELRRIVDCIVRDDLFVDSIPLRNPRDYEEAMRIQERAHRPAPLVHEFRFGGRTYMMDEEEFSGWKSVPLRQVKRKALRMHLKARARDHTIVTGRYEGEDFRWTLFIAVRADGGVDAVLADAELIE